MFFCVHAAIEEVTVDQIRLKVITVSLDQGPVRIGRDSLSCIDGVVFMVDAVDKERLNEAKKELDVRHLTVIVTYTSHNSCMHAGTCMAFECTIVAAVVVLPLLYCMHSTFVKFNCRIATPCIVEYLTFKIAFGDFY